MSIMTEEYKNNTGTELDVLKSLEQSFKRVHGADVRRNTQKSLNWFRQAVTKNYKNVRTARMFRDKSLWKNYGSIKQGSMAFFEYKAETVDFYDRYPLAFIIDKYTVKGKSYALGINLHWLQPAHRMAAMIALLRFRNEKRYRRSTKLQADWQILMGLSESIYFKHAVRLYRADRIKSTMVMIPAQSFELVAFLPLQRFVGGSKGQAYKLKRK